MATSTVVGSVGGLWRFPVKSMGGERLEQGEFTERGLVGDRAYALIDADTGKVVSAKSVRLFPDLFGCRAAFVEPPRLDSELPPVRIALPDSTSVTSDSGDVDRVLSAFFRRAVTLARAAPDDFTIDQYHPDVENVDPAGHRDTVVEQKLGSAFFAEAGLPSPVPVGSFFDLFPVSVLTTSTLAQLSELQPDSNFDERRFRMNVIVGAKEAGSRLPDDESSLPQRNTAVVVQNRDRQGTEGLGTTSSRFIGCVSSPRCSICRPPKHSIRIHRGP